MYLWNWEPQLLIGLACQAGAYLACTGPLRRFFPGSAAVPLTQVYTFVLGVLTLFIALVSPLDILGDRSLLTAHMIQHLLLTLVAPPLLLLGTPRWLLRPIVSLPYLRRISLPIARALTHPATALVLFNAVYCIWHIPRYYEAALENQTIHILEHVMFFGTAVLTWMPVFSPLDELPALPQSGQVLYLFFESVPPTLVGAMITFSKAPLYLTYARAPRLFGTTVMEDQTLGGLTMWVPGGLIFFAVLTIIFFRWFGRDDDDYWEYDTAVENA